MCVVPLRADGRSVDRTGAADGGDGNGQTVLAGLMIAAAAAFAMICFDDTCADPGPCA